MSKNNASPSPKVYDVTILRRHEVTTFPKIKTPVIIMQITYIAAGLPPFTIEMEKKKHNDISEKEAIKSSIEERLKEKPESYKV